MKIKLLIFLLLFSLCSSEVVDEGIFIDPIDLKNLKILETNENIDLSNNNFLKEVMTEDVLEIYLKGKESIWNEYSKHISKFELNNWLNL